MGSKSALQHEVGYNIALAFVAWPGDRSRDPGATTMSVILYCIVAAFGLDGCNNTLSPLPDEIL
jgi:hypothetical protein